MDNLFGFSKPPVLIEDWDGLVGLENEKYKLEIDLDGGNGWVIKKGETEEEDNGMLYLNTHTFYERNYDWTSKKLREYGFNVQLSNWDAE